jgi:hypothetical protein
MAILHFLSRKNPILSVDKCYKKDASDELFGFVLDADGMGQDMAIFWWFLSSRISVGISWYSSWCICWIPQAVWEGLKLLGSSTPIWDLLVVYQCITKRDPKMGTPSTKSADPKFLFSFCTENALLTVTQSWNIVAPCQHGFDIWRPTIAHKWHPKDPLLNQSLWRTGNPGPAKSGWKRRGRPKSQRTACQLLTVSKWVIIMQRLYLGYPISIGYPMDIQWISQLGS